MKSLLLAVALLPFPVLAQETMPPLKAREVAGQLGRLYGELTNSIFVSRPDLARPHAVAAGNLAMVVIPESGLNAEQLKSLGDKLVPVGVLWLRGLLPGDNGLLTSDNDGVRSITVTDGQEKAVVHPFHLGVRMGERGRPTLELYGGGKTPLVTERLLPLPSKHDVPIELSVFGGDGDGAILMVSLVGKFQGEVSIRKHDAVPAKQAVMLRSLADADKAVQAGHAVMPHLNDFPATPVRVDGAPDQATLFEAGDAAALVVPHARIRLAELAPGEEMPVGQLWLKDLLPEVAGKAVAAKDVKVARVEGKGRTMELPQFLLTARRAKDGELTLAVYSAATSALLSVPLKPVRHAQSRQVELDGRQSGERRGILTFSIGGTHAAELVVRPTR